MFNKIFLFVMMMMVEWRWFLMKMKIKTREFRKISVVLFKLVAQSHHNHLSILICYFIIHFQDDDYDGCD